MAKKQAMTEAEAKTDEVLASTAKDWWKRYPKENWTDAFLVPVDNLEADPLNPNEMDDQQFEMLKEDIKQHGFDEPLQVVPKEDEVGKFIIVGGEHRWRGAKDVGLKKIPVVIKESWIEAVARKENLIRRNENRGMRNPLKVRRIVLDLRNERRLQLDEEARRFGFARVEQFKEVLEARQQFTKDVIKKNKAEKEDEEEAPRQVHANLDWVVRNVLAQYGDTVPKGFIFFCHGDQFHLMLQMEPGLADCVKQLVKMAKTGDAELSDMIEEALRSKYDFSKLAAEQPDEEAEPTEAEEEPEEEEDSKESTTP